jgi:hypothetical protein
MPLVKFGAPKTEPSSHPPIATPSCLGAGGRLVPALASSERVLALCTSKTAPPAQTRRAWAAAGVGIVTSICGTKNSGGTLKKAKGTPFFPRSENILGV